MIIQCPACSTKFSVDEQLLDGISAPRFHCSRCSHFFEFRVTDSVTQHIPEPANFSRSQEPTQNEMPFEESATGQQPESPAWSEPQDASESDIFYKEQMAALAEASRAEEPVAEEPIVEAPIESSVEESVE